MLVNINEIKPTQNNPREFNQGKLEQLKKSIKEFPEMMAVRPIVVNENMDIIGGNMRYMALKDLGYTEVEIVVFNQEDKEYEFLIKDNLAYGEWAWVNLSEDYKYEELTDWGLTPPVWYKELNKEEKTPAPKTPEGNTPVVNDANFSKKKAVYLFYTKAEKEEVLGLIKDKYKGMSLEEVFISLIKNNIAHNG